VAGGVAREKLPRAEVHAHRTRVYGLERPNEAARSDFGYGVRPSAARDCVTVRAGGTHPELEQTRLAVAGAEVLELELDHALIHREALLAINEQDVGRISRLTINRHLHVGGRKGVHGLGRGR